MTTPPFRLPAGVACWRIAGLRVPACLAADATGADAEGLVRVDLTIAGGRIETIVPAGTAPGEPSLPVLQAPGIGLPCFVDAHTHLDKGHIWPRAPNPDGSFAGAREAVPVDREARWTARDVGARADFALACAYAHGTRAIRTHIDSIGSQTRISWPAIAEARERWAGRIDLQASPLFGTDRAFDETHMADVTAMVAAFGRCLGAVTYPTPTLKPELEALFRLASDRGWELDFHADETGDPTIDTLGLIAEVALAFRFPHRVLCGHCCTLTVMPDDARRRTIDRVAEAGLSVVSLPLVNMYLQDREGGAGRTPRWRGVTALKELKAAGVPVMIASDNTRDPFHAYGDLDMLEVWREGTRIAHLDHPFGDWAAAVTTTPARALGLGGERPLRAGAPADLVILPARSLSELMARPLTARTVIRDGRPIAAAPPPYATLDNLEGLAP